MLSQENRVRVTSRARSPCRRALRRITAFPSGVCGPVERRAFAWFAAFCRSLVMVPAFTATNGDREPRLPVRELMQKNLAVYSMSLAGVPHPDRRRAQSDIAAWTATPGRILSVAARFPLYQIAAAHQTVEAGGKVGTVVVEP